MRFLLSLLQIADGRLEEEMLRAAKSRSSTPQEEEMQRNGEFYSDLEYRVAKTGAVSTMQSAKSLVNEYCQKLPADR